jgi:long-subunit fatty acid transport protein
MVSAETDYMLWSNYLDCLYEKPSPAFRNVFDFKAGLEKQVVESSRYFGDVIVRGGYGYWKSPVPEQTGDTNFLDNDKHIFSMGAEFRWKSLGSFLPKPFSVQAMGQYQYLVDRTYHKSLTGEKITFGGYAYAAGISIEFEY